MIFNKRKLEQRDKLENILSIAEGIIQKKPQKLDLYVKVIGYSVLNKLIMQLISGENVSELRIIENDIFQFKNRGIFYKDTTEEERKTYRISLEKHLVIPVAWEQSRFINNITSIGSDIGRPFKMDKVNHYSLLVLPLGYVIITNGNHSVLTGILNNEGEIYPTAIIDLTPYYEEGIYFDGIYYRDKQKRKLYKLENFEFGALYEIGRLKYNIKNK